jgi:hypothetical protein
LLSLLEKWGGTIDVDGKISWQTTAPTQSTGVGSSGDKERQNPALGITKYRVPNGMLKISRIVDQLPSDLYSQVGRIRRTVPRSDGLPTPDNRYWLTHMPQVSRKGAVWEVIDNYELTDEMTADQLRFARDVYRDAL